MADNQRKTGGLFTSEGLIVGAIDNMAMPLAGVWYEYECDTKNASFAVQASGDIAMDMSLSTGDTSWRIKAGTVLAMDGQIWGKRIQFRHEQPTPQMLQVMRLI